MNLCRIQRDLIVSISFGLVINYKTYATELALHIEKDLPIQNNADVRTQIFGLYRLQCNLVAGVVMLLFVQKQQNASKSSMRFAGS